jgi:hypothetical protein
MSEQDDDVLLRQAFGQLAHLTRHTVRPVGVRAARTRAVQRRNRRVAALICLGALVIVLPAAIFAGTVRRVAPPVGPSPVRTDSTLAPTASTPSPTASTPPPETVTKAAAGAGELANATVTMPLPQLTTDGGCGNRPLKYVNGHA